MSVTVTAFHQIKVWTSRDSSPAGINLSPIRVQDYTVPQSQGIRTTGAGRCRYIYKHRGTFIRLPDSLIVFRNSNGTRTESVYVYKYLHLTRGFIAAVFVSRSNDCVGSRYLVVTLRCSSFYVGKRSVPPYILAIQSIYMIHDAGRWCVAFVSISGPNVSLIQSQS